VSQENVEVVQTLSLPSDTDLVQLVHDDVVWSALADRAAPFVDPEAETRLGVGMGEATRTYIGPDGFREALIDWYGVWEEYYVAVHETIDCGHRVLRLTEHTARMPGSASTVSMPASEVWTFRDGMVVSLESYPNHEEGRKAVGLEE
jgi:ketosteroid isomerase-like protein